MDGMKSKKTLALPELTRDQKRYLRKIAKPHKAPDWGAVIGGKQRTRHVVWRPGNWLFAIHRFFTLSPKIHWEPHWRSVWWLWFEVSRADEKRYSPRLAKARAMGGGGET